MKYRRLSTQKHRQIIRCFCADITATACAEIVGVNRNTVNSWYNEFRHKIFLAAIAETRAEGGEFEVDESCFGARRVRGKRGRGAAGKTPVFGLLKRGGKVVVRMVSDCSMERLMPIIQGLVLEGSTIHSGGWAAYDGLIVRIRPRPCVPVCSGSYTATTSLPRGKSHVNGIENAQTAGLPGASPSAGLRNSTVAHPTDSQDT